MTGDRSKFISLKEVKGGTITLVNNSSRRIIEKDTITLDDGMIKTQNVMLVEFLKNNLLSLVQWFIMGIISHSIPKDVK